MAENQVLPTVAIKKGDKTIAWTLSATDEAFSDDARAIITNATERWLKNEEVLTLLEQFQLDGVLWPHEAAHKPEGGSLFIFNRKLCRGFRNDKHNWRKKNDGRTVKETHEKLKVGDRERLNCYYAHADEGDSLQRRCYWILEQRKEDVVLVHYLRSNTSRVGPRGGSGTGGAGSSRAASTAVDGKYLDSTYQASTVPSGPAASRPRRAAAQRAKFIDYDKFDGSDEDNEDNDEDDYCPSSDSKDTGPQVPQRLPPPILTGTKTPDQKMQMSPTMLPYQPNMMASDFGRLDPIGIDFDSTDMNLLYQLGSSGGSLISIPSLVDANKNLPSLAQQDLAARNAGINVLPVLPPPPPPPPRFSANPSGSPTVRRLAHDPLGSGGNTVFLQSMSLGIDGMTHEVSALNFPSPTLDTSNMYLATETRQFSGLQQPGSPDSKLRPPPGAALVTSGNPITSRDGLDDARNEGPAGLHTTMTAAEYVEKVEQHHIVNTSTERQELNGGGVGRLERRQSSFGGNVPLDVMEQSGDLDVEKLNARDNKDHKNNEGKKDQAPSSEVGAIRPGTTLLHQESSVAAQVGAELLKVETIRRLKAPGFRTGPSVSGNASFASLSALTTTAQETTSQTSEDDSEAPSKQEQARGSTVVQHVRKNPIVAPAPLSVHDRVVATATAAAVITAERREERLQQVRHARQSGMPPPPSQSPRSMQGSEDDQLIETSPNHLFRLTSHVMNDVHNSGDVATADETTLLLREMSIEKVPHGGQMTPDDAGNLMRNMSIDERHFGQEEGDGRENTTTINTTTGREQQQYGGEEEQPAGRDPSLSSLLDAVDTDKLEAQAPRDAGVGSDSDILVAAFRAHKQRAAAAKRRE